MSDPTVEYLDSRRCGLCKRLGNTKARNLGEHSWMLLCASCWTDCLAAMVKST